MEENHNELIKLKEIIEPNIYETDYLVERGRVLHNRLKLKNEFAPASDLINYKNKFNQELLNRKEGNNHILNKLIENDYFSILQTFSTAIDLYNDLMMSKNSLKQNIDNIKINTNQTIKVLETKIKEKRKETLSKIPINIIAIPLVWGVVFWLIFGVGNCLRLYSITNKLISGYSLAEGNYGFLIGLTIGFIIGVYKFYKNYP